MTEKEIEQIKGLEALFCMLNKQEEEVRHELINRIGLIDLQYSPTKNKPVYIAEGIDDGISCGWVHYDSVDELLKYHVIEEEL